MQTETPSRRWWLELFTEEDGSNPYDGDYFTVRSEFGQRPALLVVDVMMSFTGEEGLTLADSQVEWPTSCGPAAWDAIPNMRRMIDLGHKAGWPVVYTTGLPGGGAFGGTVKGERVHEVTTMDLPGAVDIPDAVKPLPGELVLAKPKASAFFDTPLASYLIRNKIDTVIVVGGATSGCIRATVIDSYAHGFPTFVIEDAVFDRSRVSTGVNLGEMHMKYADVMTADEFEALVAEYAAKTAV
ncbi:isochorismatase family protein [Microbacterium sp. WCS2018Hpa-23]|uniref:cysteine hydrolase family protein n=1 Tax=Microbacterium sp. WCS2018Hpa-23 TaxID=3073634 RepID=UPI0028833C8F|nr:isochorismatase family protein [Microbacterium sp. WCS2018Hpa-23]